MDTRKIKGFTLIELMIVVIILGILSAIVIPSFRSSAAETKESSLRSDLGVIRTAIEQYRIQHEGVWPGTVNGQTSWDNFVAQMTAATDENGDPGTQFGPYLRTGIPLNPINGLNTGIEGTIPAQPDGATGWYYDSSTGEFRANCSGTGPSSGIDYFDM